MTKAGDSTNKTLRVLFAAPEADPIIKVGGLGDVTGSLPRALRAQQPELGHRCALDARVVIPFHPGIAKHLSNVERVASFDVRYPYGSIPAEAFVTYAGDLPIYLIAGGPIDSVPEVYSRDPRKDGEKYVFFSLAVLDFIRALDWHPDILHAHDWLTAISVYMLRLRRGDPVFANLHSILTIHNLPYMGAGSEAALDAFGIPPAQDPRLPNWGNYQPLPMGMTAADMLTTVSPGYAHEILTPEFGCGLQDFLQLRAGTVMGILNGLDETSWDPAADRALPSLYNFDTLERRAINKEALQCELGLPSSPELPLLMFIGRMDHQKGIDLALGALRQIAEIPWQAVLLGTGDPGLEESARRLEGEFPRRVKAAVRFDAQLSRRMYAGADMLMMPSRYEPCGLAQMIAMRYGCIPIARATGGLRDTIHDNQDSARSTGFLFDEATPEALAGALRRAMLAYNEKDEWKTLQANGMRQDFSWHRSAQDYTRLYERLIG